jgi:predicted nucleic acid-binding protein
VIYAELALSFDTIEGLDDVVAQLKLRIEQLPRPALFLAGKAFARYKTQGGRRQRVLSDFFIGAHAAVQGWPLLTRDPAGYRGYFPGVRLVSP